MSFVYVFCACYAYSNGCGSSIHLKKCKGGMGHLDIETYFLPKKKNQLNQVYF